jgi:hypothetical protein
MAKISAHGEREHVRFEGAGGAAVVLTVKPDLRPGRLLHKLGSAWGYQVVKTHRGGKLLLEAADDAEKFAAERGYTKTAVRQ